MLYFVKTPWLLKKCLPKRVWDIPGREKTLYLSFDDGPHPVITPWVLDELKKYNAKATFFCIGKNVIAYPDVYKRIMIEGHRVGNHTRDHLNGWKVRDRDYVDNVMDAARYIDSNLFRPPYGRISSFQAACLRAEPLNFSIIMWTVLSADFDEQVPPAVCARNVLRHAKPGSIVVFHDSEKAFERLKVCLPRTLEHFMEQGYRFEVIKR